MRDKNEIIKAYAGSAGMTPEDRAEERDRLESEIELLPTVAEWERVQRENKRLEAALRMVDRLMDDVEQATDGDDHETSARLVDDRWVRSRLISILGFAYPGGKS